MKILFILLSAFIFSFNCFAIEPNQCDLEKMKWMGIPFDKEGRFHQNCRPQILYSWIASPETINQNDISWPFRRKTAIFFHRTPLATSIYGSFSYRVKLKADVKYKLVDWNEAHYKCLYPANEKQNTVYVNQDPSGFSEYVLCSSGPVESWSFGLQGHLDEMTNEMRLIKRLGARKVDGFLNPNSAKYGCRTCFQGYTIHDARNDGSEQTINKSIDLMEHVVGKRTGRVFHLIDKKAYSKGPKIDEHFKTQLALPFHKK